MKKTIVIAGFNGFVGRRACKAFTEHGFEVVGITNSPINKNLSGIVSRAYQCDLSNNKDVKKLKIDNCDVVLNLAGIASNAGGDKNAIQRTNINAHLNLYRHLGSRRSSPRIIAVSSGLVYEIDPEASELGKPIVEDNALQDVRKARPYEASKILMEQAIAQEFSDLDIVIARPFNHLGPGQNIGFICPDLASQIEEALLKKKTVIYTGNLKTLRDYSHVDDIIDGYLKLASSTELNYKVYNLCSGKAVSGEKILKTLLSAYKVSLRPTIDPKKLRKNEVKTIVGSHKRITKEIGWHPSRSVESAIHDFVEERLSFK